MSKSIVLARTVKVSHVDRSASLNAIAVAVYSYADARTTLLEACREAERKGVSRDDIMEFVALTYLGKALGRQGVKVADLPELRAIAAKPSNTTKLPDDLKRSDKEEAAWTAARQGKSRAVASLGWIAKGKAAPIATNAEKHKARRDAASQAPVPVDAKLALPKFQDGAMALAWFGNLAKLMVQCQKQNAKHIPAPIATLTSDYVAGVNACIELASK